MHTAKRRQALLRSLLGGTAALIAFSQQQAAAQTAGPCDTLAQIAVAPHEQPIEVESVVHRDAGPAPAPQLPPGVPPPPAEMLPAHCEFIGAVQRRAGVDGQTYAIRFHVRLPDTWNGKLFFQGGGGSNGELGDAIGRLGASPSALAQGYAVLSQDSGHDNATNSDPARGGAVAFGFDPEARRNYGGASLESAVIAARTIVKQRYGKAPQYSYFVGCSKGGQEGLALAERYPTLFDGIVAMAPGLSLPRAAVAEAWDTQAFAAVVKANGASVTPLSLAQSFSDADFALATTAVLAACDADDGLADGMINAFEACTSARVLPELAKVTCKQGKQDNCLSAAQVEALERVHAGARDSSGKAIYAGFPWDAGWSAPGWRIWKIGSADGRIPALNLVLGGPSLGAVFTTPPTAVPPGPVSGLDFQMHFDMDRDAAKIYATGGSFKTSAWQDISARATDLRGYVKRGGKLIVAQGVSDPVFSISDTIDWYKAVLAAGGAPARDSLRLFAIPGMNHCNGGFATDQFGAFAALVDWVERKQAPERIEAHASPMSPWAQRSRPLCAYPKIARYKGAGDPEDAASFTCS